jgi:hypothetical protein
LPVPHNSKKRGRLDCGPGADRAGITTDEREVRKPVELNGRELSWDGLTI